MTRYVALLRGINVGGKNLIRMADLRACLLGHGFQDVSTYIQSGNVLFAAEDSGREELVLRLEGILAAAFDYQASVVLLSHAEMRVVVDGAPEGFGGAPTLYRYDVMFLKPPLTAATAIESVPTKEGVDEVFASDGVLYFSRLVSRATQSKLSRIVSMPIYQSMTIRNWNTTTKLLRLLDAINSAYPLSAGT